MHDDDAKADDVTDATGDDDATPAQREQRARLRRRVGSPSYNAKRHPRAAATLAVKGWTHAQIAGGIGIGVATLYRWRRRFPDFARALATRKVVADARVERALYRRACGYTAVDVETVKERAGTAATGRAEWVTVAKRVKRRHVPGDVTAQMYWLTNRAPDEWQRNPDPATANANAERDAHVDEIVRAIHATPENLEAALAFGRTIDLNAHKRPPTPPAGQDDANAGRHPDGHPSP